MSLTQDELGVAFPDALPFRGVGEKGFRRDWLGMLTSEVYEGQTYDENTYWTPGFPAITEEYWEWISIAESARGAQDRYVMFELGAGYGRWCMAAEGYLRQLRKPIPRRYVAVEAEPCHFQWLTEHFAKNGVVPGDHRLVQAAVSAKEGTVTFAVGNPSAWYGQAIVEAGYAHCATAEVNALTLSSLVASEQLIDLIDMDVQGVELEIVHEAIGELNRSTKRLHIGTHYPEVEEGLRKVLASNGWTCLFDFKCGRTNDTPYGPVEFGDGVQAWVNPRLI